MEKINATFTITDFVEDEELATITVTKENQIVGAHYTHLRAALDLFIQTMAVYGFDKEYVINCFKDFIEEEEF